jgi:heme exporter protein D
VCDFGFIVALALALVLVLVLVLCFIELLAAARQRRYLTTCRRAQDRATDSRQTARKTRVRRNIDPARRRHDDFRSMFSFTAMLLHANAHPNAAAAASTRGGKQLDMQVILYNEVLVLILVL